MRRSTKSMLGMVTCVPGILFLAGVAATNADWSDDFNGGLNAAWQFGNVDGVGGSSATFTAGSVGDRLELTDSLAAIAGGAGAGFGVVVDLLGDQRVAGTINPDGAPALSPTLTLIARADVQNSQFYAAEVNYDSAELIIFRNDSLVSVSNLASAPLAGLTRANSVYVEFDLVGDALGARAYDAPGGTLLQTVSTTDATYTAGLSGVLVNADPTVQVLGVWDDVSAVTIPEPTTAGLLLLALGGATVFRRRR